MSNKALIDDLCKVFNKHGIAIAIVSTMQVADNGDLMAWGDTFVASPPEDHEEEVLRQSIAKKASDLVVELAEIITGG